MIYDIIISPIISEKSNLLSQEGIFTFKVARNATKEQIKLAVEKIFNTQVKSVNVCNYDGKTKRFRGHLGKRSGYKKAFIALEKGSAIDMNLGI